MFYGTGTGSCTQSYFSSNDVNDNDVDDDDADDDVVFAATVAVIVLATFVNVTLCKRWLMGSFESPSCKKNMFLTTTSSSFVSPFYTRVVSRTCRCKGRPDAS